MELYSRMKEWEGYCQYVTYIDLYPCTPPWHSRPLSRIYPRSPHNYIPLSFGRQASLCRIHTRFYTCECHCGRCGKCVRMISMFFYSEELKGRCGVLLWLTSWSICRHQHRIERLLLHLWTFWCLNWRPHRRPLVWSGPLAIQKNHWKVWVGVTNLRSWGPCYNNNIGFHRWRQGMKPWQRRSRCISQMKAEGPWCNNFLRWRSCRISTKRAFLPWSISFIVTCILRRSLIDLPTVEIRMPLLSAMARMSMEPGKGKTDGYTSRAAPGTRTSSGAAERTKCVRANGLNHSVRRKSLGGVLESWILFWSIL